MLTEKDNFLHPNICKYCIDFIKLNLNKTQKYNLRDVYKMFESDDPTIKKIIEHLQSLYKNMYLKNAELIYWPIGEKHEWHDDTIYYDHTTITYLNENYQGGRTIVEDKKIEPKTGKFISFPSKFKHCVTQLTKGHRYVMIAWFNKNG